MFYDGICDEFEKETQHLFFLSTFKLPASTKTRL